jgi:hypothetical protein
MEDRRAIYMRLEVLERPAIDGPSLSYIKLRMEGMESLRHGAGSLGNPMEAGL